MKHVNMNFKLVFLALVSVALVACGGGGSSSSTTSSPTTASDTTISGTAAQGTALSGASIAAACAGGNASATAGDDGTYSITLGAGQSLPCVLTATLAASQGGGVVTFYSAIPSDATKTVVHITPLTTLILANAIGSVPSASTSPASIATLTSAKLAAAEAIVTTALSSSSGFNLPNLSGALNGDLKAASPDGGLASNPLDMALDQFMASLNVNAANSFAALVNVFASSATSTAAGATSAVNSFFSTNALVASSQSCPYAVSGTYLIANVGSSNIGFDPVLKQAGPKFSAVVLDFTKLTSTNMNGDTFKITADTDNKCNFSISQSDGKGTKFVNFTVSSSGFVVATNIAPAKSTASGPATAGLGNMPVCNSVGSNCSNMQMGFPLQSGITTDSAAGVWQSIQWNPIQYINPTNATCSGNLIAGKVNGVNQDICNVYVSYFEQFNVNTDKTMTVTTCDGLGQGLINGSTATSCANGTKTSGLSLKLCSDVKSSDCPSYTDASGKNTTIKGVMDVVDGNGVTQAQTLVFKAPNGDFIGVFIAGPGGPANVNDINNYSFAGKDGRQYVNPQGDPTLGTFQPNVAGGVFTERFGVFVRSANRQVLPKVCSSSTTACYADQKLNASDSYVKGVAATFSTSAPNSINITDAYSGMLNLVPGLSLTAYSQSSKGWNFRKDTMISSCPAAGCGKAGAYGLFCGLTASGQTQTCILANGTGSYNGTSPKGTDANNMGNSVNFMGESLSNYNETYAITSVTTGAATYTPYSLTGAANASRYFTSTSNNGVAGATDKVYYDQPYLGMVYRPYVASVSTSGGTIAQSNESVSVRGVGWSISGSPLTLAQQLGTDCFSGQTGGTYNAATYQSTGCTGTTITGRFFTVKVPY